MAGGGDRATRKAMFVWAATGHRCAAHGCQLAMRALPGDISYPHPAAGEL
jgi:hypothetical protein